MNQSGLHPAVRKGSTQVMPLTVNKDLDELGLLNGVTTFSFHPHLPHYALTTDDTRCGHVLTRQSIDLDRPHPFTAAGNTEFNSCIWMPPTDQRAGDILLANFTDLHDVVRWDRKPGKVLEKPCHNVMWITAAKYVSARLARQIGGPWKSTAFLRRNASHRCAPRHKVCSATR